MVDRYQFYTIMPQTHNRPVLKTVRKRLRNNATKAEIILWKRLQRRQLNNIKFRRQHSIGRYVVDFYCPERRLAIEVDGSVHGDEKVMARDRKKQEYIEGLGIKVMRFYNQDILYNTESVLKKILEEVN